MSNVNIFNGVTFIVEKTNEAFHTYDDWELYVTNTDCIGEPKQYTKYIEIPGRNGMIDLSEATSGRQTYISRPIKIELGGVRYKTRWDSVISDFRNHINGKICRIIFDNDKSFYWRGRVSIKDFSSRLNYGVFTVDIPEAEPYKYSRFSSAEPWLWNPFNFETDMITQIGAVVITDSGDISIPHGHMATCPEIVVSDILSESFKVTYDGTEYALTAGTNIIPSIMVGGDSDVTLAFTGSATVQIVYRAGSL